MTRHHPILRGIQIGHDGAGIELDRSRRQLGSPSAWLTAPRRYSDAAVATCKRMVHNSQAQTPRTGRGASRPGRMDKPLEYRTPVRKPPPRTRSDPLRYRKLPLFLGGLTALVFSGYSAYLYASLRRAIADGASVDVPTDVSSRYDVIAPSFDSLVNNTENLLGLTRLRKKLAQQASGHVCEVSIGTGRNLKYYDWDFKGVNGVGKVGKDFNIKRGKVRSFTAVDKSGEMLEIAREKFSKDYPGVTGTQWVIQDASEPLPPPPGSQDKKAARVGKKYDTIVQTMGLCSTNDPVNLLKNLGESVDEVYGRILLLEHGRGTWNWVNHILDGLAHRHAIEFGCLWNKDIGEIVRKSGLEVVKIERKHFGTTWWIELRPKRRISVETQASEQAGNEDGDKSLGREN